MVLLATETFAIINKDVTLVNFDKAKHPVGLKEESTILGLLAESLLSLRKLRSRPVPLRFNLDVEYANSDRLASKRSNNRSK